MTPTATTWTTTEPPPPLTPPPAPPRLPLSPFPPSPPRAPPRNGAKGSPSAQHSPPPPPPPTSTTGERETGPTVTPPRPSLPRTRPAAAGMSHHRPPATGDLSLAPFPTPPSPEDSLLFGGAGGVELPGSSLLSQSLARADMVPPTTIKTSILAPVPRGAATRQNPHWQKRSRAPGRESDGAGAFESESRGGGAVSGPMSILSLFFLYFPFFFFLPSPFQILVFSPPIFFGMQTAKLRALKLEPAPKPAQSWQVPEN